MIRNFSKRGFQEALSQFKSKFEIWELRVGVHGAVGWFQGWPMLSINRTFTRNWGCPREKKCQVSASSWNPVNPVWQHDLLMLVRHFYWWPVISLCFLECDWWVGHCRQSHMPGGHTWIETGGANESSGCLVLVPRVQDTQSSSSAYPRDGGSVARPRAARTFFVPEAARGRRSAF